MRPSRSACFSSCVLRCFGAATNRGIDNLAAHRQEARSPQSLVKTSEQDGTGWLQSLTEPPDRIGIGNRRTAVGADEARQLLQLKTKRGGSERLGAVQSSLRALLGVNVDACEAEQPSVRGINLQPKWTLMTFSSRPRERAFVRRFRSGQRI